MTIVESIKRGRWGVLALALGLAQGAALAGGDWNDGGIAWLGFDEARETARASGKPICLIVYTEWCSHCTNYAKLFHDPTVVEKAKQFAMVRLDKDRHKELTARFAPDGQYIPRTYFLSKEGELDPALHARREKYKYFYHESDPASILAGMDRALAKLK